MAASGLQFQVDDFILPRFFKPYISKIVLPDGLILSRIDKLVEKILVDFEGEQSITLIMLADFTNKFYREFQKRINSRAGLIQVNILYAKQTYMKCLIAPSEN